MSKEQLQQAQVMAFYPQAQSGLLDPAEYLKNIPIKAIIERKQKTGFNLITLPENTSVEEAMKLLGNNNFQAVPVVSQTGQYLGFLTQIELVNFCLSVSMDVSTTRGVSHEDVLCAAKDVERLKDRSRQAFTETNVGSLMNKPSKRNWLPMQSPWLTIDWNESVFNACEKFFVDGYRRIAVLDDNENVCGMLTQSDIIQLLARNTTEPTAREPLGIFERMSLQQFLGDECNKIQELLVTMPWSSPLIHAFYMMFEKNVPCVVVTDERRLPMSVVTASDVRRFNHSNVDMLVQPLGKFTSGPDILTTGPPVTVTLKENTGEVFSRLQLYGIHQCVVVNENGSAIGVLPMQLLINAVVRLELTRRQQQGQGVAAKGLEVGGEARISGEQVAGTGQEKKASTTQAGGETEEMLPIPTSS